MAVVRGQAAPGDEQAGADDHAGLDGVTEVDVDEVLLAHDSHRRGAGRQIFAEIARGRERLRHRPAAELTELIALARDDRRVAVAVDETGHHEPVAEIHRLRTGRDGTTIAGADARDAPVAHHDERVAQRRGACAVEQRAAADRANGHLTLR